jgi:hypothetical protein
MTLNQRVQGSNPCAPTTSISDINRLLAAGKTQTTIIKVIKTYKGQFAAISCDSRHQQTLRRPILLLPQQARIRQALQSFIRSASPLLCKWYRFAKMPVSGLLSNGGKQLRPEQALHIAVNITKSPKLM